MGYTVDKKTGKIILVHDVTVSSKAVKQPETQQQPQQRQQEAIVKRLVRIVKARRIQKLTIQEIRDGRSVARFECCVQVGQFVRFRAPYR